MATTNFVSYGSFTQVPTKWSRAFLHAAGHAAGHEVDEESSVMQLWKQHHKQGMFNASTRFGFTGMLSRLNNQRRGR